MRMDLGARERVASEVLGENVKDGDMMRCRFEHLHTHGSGPRDLRVCLQPGKAGELPTFYCFHHSCREAWAPLNRELRRGIWFAEHGRERTIDAKWDQGGVVPAPRANVPGRLKFHPEALRRVQRADWPVNEKWMMERSPVALEGIGPREFLERLFLPDEKVLIFTKFKSQGQFIFWHGRGFFRLADAPGVRAVRSELPGGSEEGVWFLCAPVDGQWHVNPRVTDAQGRPMKSRRSMESVTAWRYMVLESDEADPTMWLNFLAQLPLPISAIYTSGGRSIHALVRIDAVSKEGWDKVKRVVLPLLTKLGADGAAITAVRLTRLPGCLRGNRLQKLLYLNPAPDPSGVPIGNGGNLICA